MFLVSALCLFFLLLGPFPSHSDTSPITIVSNSNSTVCVCVCVSNWNFIECMWFLYLCVSIIGFHVSIAIGGLHGYRASSDDEGDRQVHIQQRVLRPDWHIHCLGVCRVSISGAVVTSFWISGRLFHNQWLSISYLERPHQALTVFPLPCTILCSLSQGSMVSGMLSCGSN